MFESQKFADVTVKSCYEKHYMSDDIQVYTKVDRCNKCKDQSVYWFDDGTGFCMKCRQGYLLVEKPVEVEEKRQMPKYRKNGVWIY